MKNPLSRRSGLVVVLTVLLGVPAVAEVAVYVRPNGQTTPYVLGAIIDESDPFTIAWRRLNVDSPRRAVLNDQGETNGDGKPSVLFNTVTGESIVAWSRNSPSGFDVVLSVFANGAWATPIVLAGSAGDELDPHLTADPSDGSVHLVYWVNDVEPRVMHREAPADLSTWTSPSQVSLVGETAARPNAGFVGGALRVVYESHANVVESTPRQIVLATREETTFVTEVVSTTHLTEPNRPEVHTAFDRLWVDWIDDTGLMSWSRRQADGSWNPVQSEPFADIEERDYHVRGRIKGLALE